MKKTKLFTCASVSLALVGGMAAGFLCSTSAVAANGVTVEVPTSNDETKTVYLDIDKVLSKSASGNDERWDKDGAKLDIWSWEVVTATREISPDVVYFVNTDNWATPYAHFWGGSKPTEYPGIKMELVEGTSNVYYTYISDNKSIIFNDGTDKTKTDDLTIPTTGGTLYNYDEKTWGDSFEKAGKNTLFKKVEDVDNLYSAEIPAGDTNACFVRANKSWVFDETTYPTDVWDEVKDQELSESKNCLNITDWKAGTMRRYTPVEDGYYILGSINNWVPSSGYMMNPDTEGVYSLEVGLDTFDLFKAAHVTRGGVASDNDWYGYDKLTGTAKSDEEFIRESNLSSNILVANKGMYTPKITIVETEFGQDILFDCDSVEFVKAEELLVNGVKYNLVENKFKSGELVTTKEVELKSGDVIAYYTNAKLNTANPKSVGNNNCWSNEGRVTACLNQTAFVYVDTTDKTAMTIFCDGLPTQEEDKNVFGLSLNNDYVKLFDNGITSGNEEWYVYGLSLKQNDRIKFVNTNLSLSHAEVFPVKNLGNLPEELADKFTTDDNGIIYVGDESISIDLYAQFGTTDVIYITTANKGLKSATDYATAFNQALAKVCDPTGQSTVEAELIAAWKQQASDFEKLEDQAAKDILTNALSTDPNKQIAAFASQYDFIFAKYGKSLELKNFAGRPEPKVPSHDVISKSDTTALIAIATTIAIVAASSIAVVTIAKKRKEN